MSSIGGYFSLELAEKKEYHSNAIKLNTGRNALEYILLVRKYKKIYIPYYTCDVLLEPIKKLKIEVEFYYIDKNFEPVFDFEKVTHNQVFLYTNYFGFKDEYVKSLKSKTKNLIIDNAQAFFAKANKGMDTFYSARKFFGVPDGAYLYCDMRLKTKLKQDVSWKRFQHLLIRLDKSAEEGFSFFQRNDESLKNEPILKMSNLTNYILKSISYEEVAKQRIENYEYLQKKLGPINGIKVELTKGSVPIVYPFYTDYSGLRKKLEKNKIYSARYWESVTKLVNKNAIEFKYSKNLINLPIDQRINKVELNKIIKIIKDEYKR